MESEVYTIVGAAEANPQPGRISNESPLGKLTAQQEDRR